MQKASQASGFAHMSTIKIAFIPLVKTHTQTEKKKEREQDRRWILNRKFCLTSAYYIYSITMNNTQITQLQIVS